MSPTFELLDGLTPRQVTQLLGMLGTVLDENSPDYAGDVQAWVDCLVEDPAAAPREILGHPQFPTLYRALSRTKSAMQKAAERQAVEVKNAKRRASRAGILGWRALVQQPESGPQVQAFEQAMLARGWLDVERTKEAHASEQVAWTLKLAGLSASSGHLSFYLTWSDLWPLLKRFDGNMDALALAIALELSEESLARVPNNLAPSICQKVLSLYTELWAQGGDPVKVALQGLSMPSLRLLTRIPPELRWPLVYRKGWFENTSLAQRRQPITPRNLNWAQYQKAKTSPAARLEAMPPKMQWQRLTGLPVPLRHIPPLVGLKVSTLKQLLAVAQLDDPQALKLDRGNLMPILNLVRLFGDVEAVRRFVRACGKGWDRKGLHDAGQFTLPQEGWTPSKWAPLCLRHPKAVTYAQEFAQLEKAGVFPQSWATLQQEVLRRTYPKALPGMEPLQAFCLDNKLSASVFREAQEFWSKAKVKTAEFLPQVRIKGSELGLSDDWRFFRLASDDFRGPLLGQMTGCCQHLSGAGAACARHGVTSPFSAFYVLTFKGQVFAQSWAWRTEQGSLVFDSIESKPVDEASLAAVTAFYREASARLMTGPLRVQAVFVGATDSGITRQVLTQLGITTKTAIVHREPAADFCSYQDGDAHALVAGKPRKTKVKLGGIEGYSRDVRKPRLTMSCFEEAQRFIDRWEILAPDVLANLDDMELRNLAFQEQFA